MPETTVQIPTTPALTYTVNALTGDDRGPGTSGHPLASLGEVARRMRAARAATVYVVDLQTDITEIVYFDLRLPPVYSAALIITGTQTIVGTGVITGVQLYNPVTRTDQRITASGLPVSWTASGFVGKMIRLTSGPNAGYSAWVHSDLGGKQAIVSPFSNPDTGLIVNPAVSDTFEIVSVPTINGALLGTCAAGEVVVNYIRVVNDNDTSVDPFVWFGSGTVFLNWCRISGNTVGHAVSDAGCVVSVSTCWVDSHARATNGGMWRFGGCLFTGSGTAPTADGKGSSVFIDQPCVGYGEQTFLQSREAGKWVISENSWYAAFDQSVGAVVSNNAQADILGPLWGTGITTTGLQVSSGGNVYIKGANTPNLVNSNSGPTFPTKQVSLGGSSVTYATIAANLGAPTPTLTQNPDNAARIIPLVS